MKIKLALNIFSMVLFFKSASLESPLICLPLVCDLKCDYGLAKDGNGCDVCRCANPCEIVKCSAGYKCQVKELECFAPPCPFQGVCRPVCQPLPCLMNCEFGLATDSRGCNICKCYNPCQKKICPPGSVCKAEPRFCIWQPCFPLVTCVTKCIPVACKIACAHGFAKDENGCEICKCYEPCQFVKCSAGFECQVEQPPCISPTCPFQGVCRPVCKPLPCRMNCEFGLATDARGCNICKCYNPCQKKLCPRGTVCKATPIVCKMLPCPPSLTCVPKCNPVLCLMHCPDGFTKDENGCEICACQDPCQEMICEEGTVCKMVQVQCVRDPCLPIPMCVDEKV